MTAMPQFTATKWDGAGAKVKFVEQFKEFVLSGFDRSKFPKWFYTRLSMCFGMISHYDINGFYAEYFEDREGKIRFVEKCAEYPCWGDPVYTYSDAERYLKHWMAEELIVTRVKGGEF